MLLEDVILRDTRANQPAAASTTVGALYYVTDESKLERNSGSAWESAAPSPSELLGLNTQTGASYTLALSDAGKLVEMNNAGANTLTVPPNGTIAFPVNTRIDVVQYGAITLYKRATNEWVVIGDLA